jgi:hypothetical protein
MLSVIGVVVGGGVVPWVLPESWCSTSMLLACLLSSTCMCPRLIYYLLLPLPCVVLCRRCCRTFVANQAGNRVDIFKLQSTGALAYFKSIDSSVFTPYGRVKNVAAHTGVLAVSVEVWCEREKRALSTPFLVILIMMALLVCVSNQPINQTNH